MHHHPTPLMLPPLSRVHQVQNFHEYTEIEMLLSMSERLLDLSSDLPTYELDNESHYNRRLHL